LCTISHGQQCGAWGGCSDPSAPCCSKWGYCGVGDQYCGAGCLSGCGQSGGGQSNGGSTSTRCGADWGSANSGCNGDCVTHSDCSSGQHCYRDLSMNPCSNSNTKPPASNPIPPPPSNSGGSGSVSSLISQGTFTQALSNCGVNRPDIYNSLVSGFTAPLNGGLNELALLIGNLAHESGGFQYTEEIACAGVTTVTPQCPYGLYHGRGYIQLSWQANYQACANYWNNQEIVNNPDVVKNNPTVNWQTVQWFWTSSVQPTFQRDGYTLGASVRAINGGIECDNGPIAAQRVQYIQCFQKQFGAPVDYNTRCPASAQAEQANTYDQGTAGSDQLPGFATALIVLSVLAILLVVGIVVLAFLVVRANTKHV